MFEQVESPNPASGPSELVPQELDIPHRFDFIGQHMLQGRHPRLAFSLLVTGPSEQNQNIWEDVVKGVRSPSFFFFFFFFFWSPSSAFTTGLGAFRARRLRSLLPGLRPQLLPAAAELPAVQAPGKPAGRPRAPAQGGEGAGGEGGPGPGPGMRGAKLEVRVSEVSEVSEISTCGNFDFRTFRLSNISPANL